MLYKNSGSVIMKQAVLAVLGKHPAGMRTHQLLNECLKLQIPGLKPPTVDPYLSPKAYPVRPKGRYGDNIILNNKRFRRVLRVMKASKLVQSKILYDENSAQALLSQSKNRGADKKSMPEQAEEDKLHFVWSLKTPRPAVISDVEQRRLAAAPISSAGMIERKIQNQPLWGRNKVNRLARTKEFTGNWIPRIYPEHLPFTWTTEPHWRVQPHLSRPARARYIAAYRRAWETQIEKTANREKEYAIKLGPEKWAQTVKNDRRYLRMSKSPSEKYTMEMYDAQMKLEAKSQLAMDITDHQEQSSVVVVEQPNLIKRIYNKLTGYKRISDLSAT